MFITNFQNIYINTEIYFDFSSFYLSILVLLIFLFNICTLGRKKN